MAPVLDCDLPVEEPEEGQPGRRRSIRRGRLATERDARPLQTTGRHTASATEVAFGAIFAPAIQVPARDHKQPGARA